MAKPTAPLLSFGARGQIGKTMVAASWKGRPYFRQYVIPGNPNTVGQQLTRSVFANMNSVWKVAGTLLRAPWTRFATGQVLTDRNAFMGQNVKVLRGESDLTKMIFSPGAKGGLAPTSVVVTPGSSQLSIAFTNPAPPTGWTLDSAICAAIEGDDPETMTAFNTVEDEDDVSQATVVLTGLTPSQSYRVGSWLRWIKPDGSIAYGASLNDVGVPTA